MNFASAHPKIESCSKVGAIKTKDKTKYVCVKKSNNKKIWEKVSKNNNAIIKEAPLNSSAQPTLLPIKKDSEVSLNPTPKERESDTKTPAVDRDGEVNNNPISSTPESESSNINKRDIFNKYKQLSETSSSVYYQWGAGYEKNIITERVIFSISPKFSQVGVDTIKERINNSINQLKRYASNDRIKLYVEVGFPEDIRAICERVTERYPLFNLEQCSANLLNDVARQPYISTGTIANEGNFSPIIGNDYSPNASVTIYYVIPTEEALYNWMFASLEHEYFHVLQKDEVGVRQVEHFPCWLQEGSASYFSILISTLNNPDAFTQFRSKYFSWINIDSNGEKSTPTVDYLHNWVMQTSVRYKSEDGLNRCSSIVDSIKIYSQGALLTEWMISKIGFTNFFIMLRDFETVGFDQAFEKHFTKTIESSYAEMAEYLYRENSLTLENSSWLNAVDCYYFLDTVDGICRR
jgi:hypothetical protein